MNNYIVVVYCFAIGYSMSNFNFAEVFLLNVGAASTLDQMGQWQQSPCVKGGLTSKN